jgi:hypothetical protein
MVGVESDLHYRQRCKIYLPELLDSVQDKLKNFSRFWKRMSQNITEFPRKKIFFCRQRCCNLRVDSTSLIIGLSTDTGLEKDGSTKEVRSIHSCICKNHIWFDAEFNAESFSNNIKSVRHLGSFLPKTRLFVFLSCFPPNITRISRQYVHIKTSSSLLNDLIGKSIKFCVDSYTPNVNSWSW